MLIRRVSVSPKVNRENMTQIVVEISELVYNERMLQVMSEDLVHFRRERMKQIISGVFFVSAIYVAMLASSFLYVYGCIIVIIVDFSDGIYRSSPVN